MAQGDQFFLTSAAARVELTDSLSVGRSQDCDLVISEGQPSRKHALLTLEGDEVTVEDLASTNGTYINGTRIDAKQVLHDGDKVAFDASEFLFEVIKAVQEDSDKTVLRQAIEDPNRTVLRPMPTLDEESKDVADAGPVQPESVPVVEATPTPEVAQTPVPPEPAPVVEPPSPPPPPPPPPAAAAVEPPKPVKPGSWADPNEKNASSTQFFSPEDLAAMRGSGAKASVESEVPCLQVTSGAGAGGVIQLVIQGDSTEWSIGSDSARDIVFTDQGVSEFHTKLVCESGRWKIVDQMSTNGTFVNGNKAVAGFLNSGDVIRIGTVESTFVLPGGVQSAKTAQQASASGDGNNKALISVGVFVLVLAVLFGGYFLL